MAMNYGDRPSKAVTRAILVEVFHRMAPLGDLSKYEYVGLGAHQFLDFDLVHRRLGIERMTSIESDGALIARCWFNAPYKTIKILQGTVSTVVPSLTWTGKSLVWFDYTQRLRNEELADCQNLALRLEPGSAFAITLNCDPGADGSRRSDLDGAVGAERVPLGTTEARLGDWGLARVQRELVVAEIQTTLRERGDGASWKQLLNIHYRDRARMQLIMGVIDHPTVHSQLEACRFGDLAEVSYDGTATVIAMPELTSRERQELGRKLPTSRQFELAGLPRAELDSYAKYYRWLDAVV